MNWSFIYKNWHLANSLMSSGACRLYLANQPYCASVSRYGITGRLGRRAGPLPFTSAVHVERYIITAGLPRSTFGASLLVPNSPSRKGKARPTFPGVTRARRPFQHGYHHPGLYDVHTPVAVAIRYLALLSRQHDRIINVHALTAHHERI